MVFALSAVVAHLILRRDEAELQRRGVAPMLRRPGQEAGDRHRRLRPVRRRSRGWTGGGRRRPRPSTRYGWVDRKKGIIHIPDGRGHERGHSPGGRLRGSAPMRPRQTTAGSGGWSWSWLWLASRPPCRPLRPTCADRGPIANVAAGEGRFADCRHQRHRKPGGADPGGAAFSRMASGIGRISIRCSGRASRCW